MLNRVENFYRFNCIKRFPCPGSYKYTADVTWHDCFENSAYSKCEISLLKFIQLVWVLLNWSGTTFVWWKTFRYLQEYTNFVGKECLKVHITILLDALVQKWFITVWKCKQWLLFSYTDRLYKILIITAHYTLGRVG